MEEARQLDVFLFLFVGMLVLSLLAGAVVLFFFFYQKKMLSQQLKISEMESAHKEDLLHSNIEQIESERRRIAADLHDELGGIFSTLKLKINQLGKNESADSLLAESRDIIDAGISSVRRISHAITPPGLEMFGLPDALEALCQKMSTTTLQAEFSCVEDFPRLGSQTELGLYRIVQELLNNSMRHAGASKIDIYLTRSNNGVVTLEYADNGIGFDPLILQHKRGLGLKNIESRASYLKAEVEWHTSPGKGLKTILHISPIEAG